MANASSIRGFIPVCYTHGAAYTGAANIFYKASGTTYAIGVGDPVIRVTASADPNGGPQCDASAVGGAITGVVVGVVPSVLRPYQPAYLGTSDSGYLLVATDHNLLFMVQEAGAGTALAVTDIGTNINMITRASCDTNTGWSKMCIDNNAKAAGYTWAIKALANIPNNAVGQSAKWLVQASLHTEVNASAQNITNI